MEPSKQELYDACKKTVKHWENKFIKSNGRPPSKLDIREADKGVRHAYCMYFKLKTSFLEDTLMDIFNDDNDNSTETNTSDTEKNSCNISCTDPKDDLNNSPVEAEEQPKQDDKVWGEHLNKKVEIVENNVKEDKKVDLNSTFAKKLFANAKFAKRNPRKSLNSSRNNSLNMSSSQPTTSLNILEEVKSSETEISELASFNTSLVVKSGSSPFPRSQSVNVISHLLEGNVSNRKVDTGWLKRVSSTTGTELPDFIEPITNNELRFTRHVDNFTPPIDSFNIVQSQEVYDENDDDDVISGSDDEISQSFHVPKKLKLSPTIVKTTLQSNTSVNNISNIVSSSILFDKPPDLVDNLVETISYKISPTVETKIQVVAKYQKENIDSENVNKIENKVDKSENSNKDDEFAFESNEDSDYEPPTLKRKRNVKSANIKKPADRKRPNRIESDESESDEKKTPARRRTTAVKTKNEASAKKTRTPRHKNETSVQKSRTPRNKTGKKNEPVIEDNEEETKKEEYEMEYSIKPPPVTVPRFKTLKNLEVDTETNPTDEPNLLLSKKEIAKNKLLKKINSGSLNENFVRLDIKKKVYVRGKKHMNFSKYKKQMWKNKKKSLYGPDMDMGGCDGGELTCFKCGKTGHMARSCKEKIMDTLLPLDAAAEEECLLPSLEEATQMARESVLAVRVPNLLTQPEKSSKNLEIENSENDEKSETESKASEYEFDVDEELEKFMLHTEIVDDQHLKSQQEINKKWLKILEENSVKPLYQLNEDGSLPETPKEVYEALNQFGHKKFRAGQEQAIMRILCGQSTLVTLSTGSGKSLCYQLPAYLYAKHQKCISLIISPLVSLMDDQVSGMASFLKAACLHTSQTATQKSKVMQLIEMGEIDVLLVSPEAVTSGEKKSGFGSILRKLPPIAFACIDEAHCVSQWSHNFRPSYLVICRVLKERLGIQTILGLTATATHATSTSILNHLQISDGHNGVIKDIPLPDNLFLSASSDMQRDAALRNLLSADPFEDFNSVIIYCTRREECERIASYLRTAIKHKALTEAVKKYKSLSTVAEPYHAGLPASKRRTVQNAFMGGYLRIVVATVAFGMGINKSDIRGVIHYNMPSSFESYVQEVGRAGRDGLPAHCHLFLDSEGNDQNELRRHIYSNSMDRHAIRKLLQKIFVPCDCKKICPRHEVTFSIQETVKLLDVPEENISTLLCYLELHERQYLELLTPVYTMCKIISYGNANNIKRAAIDCPPLAMALALQKKGEQDLTENIFEFPVVDVAAAMGWDSGIVKSKLKNLEWITENNVPKRSTLTVEFSNLGFHVRAPGNLSPSELDDALDTLFAKKKDQETTSLKQLQVVHTTLTKISEKYYHLCLSEKYSHKSVELKTKIREYFSSEQPLKEVEIKSKIASNEERIAADARSIIAMYRDNNFTGRAIARIFHGIQSPNYPAVIWGRCKFWRAHLGSDFNKVCQIATAEILRIK